MPKRLNISAVTGIVCEVRRFKAIVGFGLNGGHEQAILKLDRLFINGKRLRSENLTEVLSVGSVVKFWAHSLLQVGVDNCGWFITHAIIRDYQREFGNRIGGIEGTAEFMQALHSHVGRVDELNDHNGKIICKDNSGAKYEVFFSTTKFHIRGKNLGPNGKLTHVLENSDLINFDAIPTNPANNIKGCEWYATLLWIGKRPNVYEIESPTEVNFREIISGSNYRIFIYQLCNAKALYVKAEGRVMFLINHEFGVVLLMMKTNVLQTALFHRNDSFVCGRNMRNCDLRKFLKEGDRVHFIGVEAPKGVLTQFVASEICICKT